MPNPIYDEGYRYATEYYDLDGVKIDFEFNFEGGYISQDYVKAFYKDVDFSETQIDDSLITFIGPNQLRIPDAALQPTTRKLVIRRMTPKNLPLVDFTDGSILNERNLDKNTKQSIHDVAELVDLIADIIHEWRLLYKDITDLVTYVSNVVNSFQTQIDTINNTLTSINNAINAIQNDITNIQNDIDGIQLQISNIFSQIENMINDIEDLNTRIDNLKFTDLKDTPNSYVGEAGKLTVVNETEDGLAFKTIAEVVVDEGLTFGIPEAPVDGKPYVRKDAGWVEDVPVDTFPEAPIDGLQYTRSNGAWERTKFRNIEEYFLSDIDGTGPAYFPDNSKIQWFGGTLYPTKKPNAFDICEIGAWISPPNEYGESSLHMIIEVGYLEVSGVDTLCPTNGSIHSSNSSIYSKEIYSIAYSDLSNDTFYASIKKSDGTYVLDKTVPDKTNNYLLYKIETGASNSISKVTDLRQLNISSGGGSGSTSFLGLSDTPSDYTGQALKIINVNSSENQVEFNYFKDIVFDSNDNLDLSKNGYIGLNSYKCVSIGYGSKVLSGVDGAVSIGANAISYYDGQAVISLQSFGEYSSDTTHHNKSYLSFGLNTLDDTLTKMYIGRKTSGENKFRIGYASGISGSRRSVSMITGKVFSHNITGDSSNKANEKIQKCNVWTFKAIVKSGFSDVYDSVASKISAEIVSQNWTRELDEETSLDNPILVLENDPIDEKSYFSLNVKGLTSNLIEWTADVEFSTFGSTEGEI